MPGLNLSYNFSATLSAAAGNISPNDCLVQTPTGWLVATTANLAGGLVPQAMATSAGSANQAVSIQHTGIIPGVLAPGALAFATVDAAGHVQRTVTPSTSQLVVGLVYASGDVGLSFPGEYVGAGGGNYVLLANNTLSRIKSAFSTSPREIFDVTAYGAIPDADGIHNATGTDNYAAITAAIAAIKAVSGVATNGGAVLYFPRGFYRTSRTIVVNTPCEVLGEGGGFTTYPAAIIVADDGVQPILFTSLHQNTTPFGDGTGIGCEGGTMRGMGIRNPSAYQAAHWGEPGALPGSTALVGQYVVPSAVNGGFRGVVFRCSVPGVIGAALVNEPAWPTDYRPATVYQTGTKILQPDLDVITVPYEYTATVGGSNATGTVTPTTSLSPVWTALSAVALNSYRRPTDAKYTSYYYQATSITTGITAASEPTGGNAWPTVIGNTCVDGGVTWTCVYTYWPRTIGQTVVDGTITWTLARTAPTYADNAATWVPIFQVPGVLVNGRLHIEHCSVDYVIGNGIEVSASNQGGVPGSSNCNGCTAKRVHISSIAGHGLYVKGGDANACTFEQFDFAQCRGFGVYDWSFLGNTHIGHQAATSGRGAYASIDPNARSLFLGCYAESGQGPNRVLPPAICIGGLHGSGFDTDSGGAFRAIDSSNLNPFGTNSVISSETWGRQYNKAKANRAWVVGDVTSEDPDTGFAHIVDSITSGLSGNVQPVWTHTIGSASPVDGGVTWKCVGSNTGKLNLGKAGQPKIVLQYQAAKMASVFQFEYQESGSHPGVGWVRANIGGLDGNTSTGWSTVEATDGTGASMPNAFGIFGRLILKLGAPNLQEWRYDIASPTTNSGQIGDLTFSAAAARGGFAGWYCTARGTPDTWAPWGLIPHLYTGTAGTASFAAPNSGWTETAANLAMGSIIYTAGAIAGPQTVTYLVPVNSGADYTKDITNTSGFALTFTLGGATQVIASTKTARLAFMSTGVVRRITADV